MRVLKLGLNENWASNGRILYYFLVLFIIELFIIELAELYLRLTLYTVEFSMKNCRYSNCMEIYKLNFCVLYFQLYILNNHFLTYLPVYLLLLCYFLVILFFYQLSFHFNFYCCILPWLIVSVDLYHFILIYCGSSIPTHTYVPWKMKSRGKKR